MLLGESLEDYLECIIQLSEKGKVRSIDVAKMMQVSKPSVNKAVNVLKEKGYVLQEAYGAIQLTPAGKEMAETIIHRHRTIYKFLTEVLHIKEEVAEKDACKIEHIISEETFKSISNYITNKTSH